jgi:endo-beta-N-acetylglucosaminidase D
MAENQTPAQGFVEVFVSKLKEQSFTIVIMLGVIWYQGVMMEERVAYWQKLYEEQKTYIQQTDKEDRQNMQERIKYLQDQQDKYMQDALDELKSKSK